MRRSRAMLGDKFAYLLYHRSKARKNEPPLTGEVRYGDRRDRSDSVVEGANQRPMDGVVGRLARVDARCVRFHRVFADHVPIAKEFDVPLTDVALVFTLTLWMR